MLRLNAVHLAVCLLPLALAGCGEPADHDDPRIRPPLVRVATVERAEAGSRAFTGVVVARTQSDLGFRVAGKVLERRVETGQSVKRDAIIEQFTSGRVPLLLISLKAGGFGLTLTEADYVFILDPWWNPAAENQAIDRTHRIGQDKPVNVYRLVATDTIEEKVIALQARKRHLFDQVVGAASDAPAPLSGEDIRGLLGVDSAT